MKGYTYEPSNSATPHLITQVDLNELVRDLRLSKEQAEFIVQTETMEFTLFRNQNMVLS